MEYFKSNEGEYVHSGDYYHGTGANPTKVTLNFGTSGSSANLYESNDIVDVSELERQCANLGYFQNLKLACPVDGDVQLDGGCSYKIELNPFNYTIYCTCGTAHGLSGANYPKYVNGFTTSDNIDGGIQHVGKVITGEGEI